MIEAPPMVTPTASGTAAEELDLFGSDGDGAEDGPLSSAPVVVAAGAAGIPLEKFVGKAPAVELPETVTRPVVMVLPEVDGELDAVEVGFDREIPIVVKELGSVSMSVGSLFGQSNARTSRQKKNTY